MSSYILARAAGNGPGPGAQGSAMEEIARREKDRASAMAAKYGVPEQDVRALRARGMAWPDVDRTLDVALDSGAPPFEIAELRESGEGWGKIAERYGVAPPQTMGSPRSDGAIRDAVKETKKRPAVGTPKKRAKPRGLRQRMYREGEKIEGAKARKKRAGRIDTRAERGLLSPPQN